MSKNLILGAFDHYDYSKLAPWVNSIKETGFSGDIVLVVFNATFETVDKLSEKSVKIIAFERDEVNKVFTHKSNMPIHTERFFHFFNFLNQNYYDNVVITDVKDVVFQINPFTLLDQNLKPQRQQMVVSSEALLYRDEPWGNENIEQCFGPLIANYYKGKEIYNVGVLGGKFHYLKDMCLNIFLMSTNRPIPIVDQAVFNAIIHTEQCYETIYYSTPEDDWAIQLGTTMDPKKIDSFRPHLRHNEPQIIDNVVCNSDKQPYHIVHQWDRVPQLKEYYERKYNY